METWQLLFKTSQGQMEQRVGIMTHFCLLGSPSCLVYVQRLDPQLGSISLIPVPSMEWGQLNPVSFSSFPLSLFGDRLDQRLRWHCGYFYSLCLSPHVSQCGCCKISKASFSSSHEPPEGTAAVQDAREGGLLFFSPAWLCSVGSTGNQSQGL